MDLTRRFEQQQVWDIDFAANPHWREKAALIQALVPADVVTILDVGCGNGALTHMLAGRHVLFGLDGSRVALRRVRVPAAIAWVDRLPVDDRSFDLVLCSEVLEHLPTLTLNAAAMELKRVARRWLLVSVPFSEQLAARAVWCAHCHRSYHIYGHVQRFDLRRLRRLFVGWRLSTWMHCGDLTVYYHPWLLRIRQYLGNRWFYDAPGHPLCPYCQTATEPPVYGNRVATWCDWLNRRIRCGRTGHPYWIVGLWERA